MAHLDLRALGVPQAAPLGPLAGGVHDALADDLFVSLDRAATEPARELAARGHRRSSSTPAEELASEYLHDLPAGLSGGVGLLEDDSELLQLDPKRAKRILANRQSAARSKERKQKQAQELESRVASLQAELAAAGAAAAQAEQHVQVLARERGDLERHLGALERHKLVRDATRAALQQAAAQHEAAHAALMSQQALPQALPQPQPPQLAPAPQPPPAQPGSTEPQPLPQFAASAAPEAALGGVA